MTDLAARLASNLAVDLAAVTIDDGTAQRDANEEAMATTGARRDAKDAKRRGWRRRQAKEGWEAES